MGLKLYVLGFGFVLVRNAGVWGTEFYVVSAEHFILKILTSRQNCIASGNDWETYGRRK